MRKLVGAAMVLATCATLITLAPEASANPSGNCAAVAVTPAYPVSQILDLNQGVNGPLQQPEYIFQNTKLLKYHDNNGNENFYGNRIAWVDQNRVYHDYFNWPATLYRPGFTTMPAVVNGPYLLVVIPISQTYDIGQCTL